MKKDFMLLLSILLFVCIISGGVFEYAAAAEEEIAIVFAIGGLEDKSYNAAAYEGIKRARKELDIKFDMAEPDVISDYENYLRQFAQLKKYDLIISIGFEQTEALKSISSHFPDQEFVLIDMIVNKPNITSYVFAEEERGFLMGVAAAMMTTKTKNLRINEQKKVGVISGMKIPLIDANIAGFMAGANYIDEDVEIEYSYIGDWTDPEKGKKIALTMIANGTDIIWHTGGEFGVGVIEAAAGRQCYAIGADYDQSHIAPDTVLTNGMKFIDNTVYLAVKNFLDNHYQSNIHVLGIAENALGFTKSILPRDIIQMLEEVKQKIIDNDIEIPTKIKNVEED